MKAKAPYAKWGTQTFISRLRAEALTAPWVIPGAMNRVTFDLYIQTQLVPTLRPGDIVVLDNLSVHKSAQAEAATRACGARTLFLPQYSPDLNPIEMAFAKLKAHLRATAARAPRNPDRRTRPRVRPVPTHRVPKLLRGRRICVQISERCFKAGVFKHRNMRRDHLPANVGKPYPGLALPPDPVAPARLKFQVHGREIRAQGQDLDAEPLFLAAAGTFAAPTRDAWMASNP